MSRYIDIEPYEKDGWYLQKHYHNSYGEVIKTTPLVSVPTADAKPTKHGRWIDKAAEDCYRCSVCEEYTHMEMPRLLYHYCPNCGARMDEVEDGI